MHRFATKSLLRRLKVSSLIVILIPFLALALAGMLVWVLFMHDPDLLRLTLKLLIGFAGVIFVLAIVGFSLRCPLCRATLIRRPSCSVHPKAERALGSLRMKIATRTLLRGHFRCPYCGEFCDTTKARRP